MKWMSDENGSRNNILRRLKLPELINICCFTPDASTGRCTEYFNWSRSGTVDEESKTENFQDDPITI